MDEPTKAEIAYKQALLLAEKISQSDRTSRLMHKLGDLAHSRGDYRVALTYYHDALSLFDDLEHRAEMGILVRQMGDVYLATERWADAEAMYTQALELSQQTKDPNSEARIQRKLGVAVQSQGKWMLALDAHRSSLARFAQIGDNQQQALALESIGDVHLESGNLTEAEAVYRSSLELERGQNDKGAVARLDEKLASLCVIQERWDEALAFDEQALQDLDSDDSRSRAELFNHMGEAEMSSRRWDRAEQLFNQALALYQALDDRRRIGESLAHLARLARAQRQWDEAMHLYEEAIEFFREQRLPVNEAEVLTQIARLKIETNQLTEAEIFAEAALAIFHSLGSAQQQSDALFLRGLLASERQEFGDALQLFGQAAALFPAHWEAQVYRAGAFLATGQVQDSVLQAEVGLGHSATWELASLVHIAIARLYQDDVKTFKTAVKTARVFHEQARERRLVSVALLNGANVVLNALGGETESALDELGQLDQQPALPTYRTAYRLARLGLLLVSCSSRRFKGKANLVSYFAPPKPRKRKAASRRAETLVDLPPSSEAPTTHAPTNTTAASEAATDADEAGWLDNDNTADNLSQSSTD